MAPGSTGPKKRLLDLNDLLKPVAKVDTSIGKLSLFPLRVSDISEYENLSALDADERSRAFLGRIASLSPDQSLDQKRIALTTDQIAQLSNQDLEALADAYASVKFSHGRSQKNGVRDQLTREADESATSYMDRLMRREIQEQAQQLKEMNERAMGSAKGIFDQLRKSTQALGNTWSEFDRLNKARARPTDASPVMNSSGLDLGNLYSEREARFARERAEDREIARLTGQMSAQSAKTLQELADASSTMLEQLDARDREAKQTTNTQLWIAVVSVVVSAFLAVVASWVAVKAYQQDRANIVAGDMWQAKVLTELKARNVQETSNAAENRVLRAQVERLNANVKTLEDRLAVEGRKVSKLIQNEKARISEEAR